MADKPILFSGSMVRAILEGRKERHRIYTTKGQETNPEHLFRRLVNGLDDAIEAQCWEWKRSKNIYGYGTLRVNGKTVLAHRLAYSLFIGNIPKGLLVCHKCDNPGCINPHHLFVGTQTDNMADCSRKGRINNPIASFPGELNPSARLTKDDVDEIKRRLKTGEVQRIIAIDFGVTQSQISNISRGLQWK